MSGEQQHRSWDAVFDDEIRELRARRTDPPTGNDRVGIAFSGGGIRSATFGLGVLEALKQRGLLKKLHYLSTVSGGGYIGAWLSASCRRHPDWLEPDAKWDDSVDHLRRYSNYLSPKVGFFSADTWSMFTIWMRNTILVQVTVVLAVACVLLLPRLLVLPFHRWPDVGNWRWTSIVLFILAVVGIAGNQKRVSSQRQVRFLQAKSWPPRKTLRKRQRRNHPPMPQ
jgi:predicted acylesterase/phospholipase RssA